MTACQDAVDQYLTIVTRKNGVFVLIVSCMQAAPKAMGSDSSAPIQGHFRHNASQRQRPSMYAASLCTEHPDIKTRTQSPVRAIAAARVECLASCDASYEGAITPAGLHWPTQLAARSDTLCAGSQRCQVVSSCRMYTPHSSGTVRSPAKSTARTTYVSHTCPHRSAHDATC